MTGNKEGKAPKEIPHRLSVGDSNHSNLNTNSSCCKPCFEQLARACMGRRTDLYKFSAYASPSAPHPPQPLLEASGHYVSFLTWAAFRTSKREERDVLKSAAEVMEAEP